MGAIINLQLSIFGTFESIKFESVNVSQLISIYKGELVPTVIPIKLFDPANNKLQSDNRINLISPNGEDSIVILPNRIDYNFSPIDSQIMSDRLIEKLQQMNEWFSMCLNELDIVGNRLAINGKFVSEKKSYAVFDNHIIQTNFFDKDTIGDWSLSRNKIINLIISEVSESCNCIFNLSGKNIKEEITNADIAFDINTSASDTRMRFNKASFSCFFDQSIEELDSILASME